jgi:hypothetical protein
LQAQKEAAGESQKSSSMAIAKAETATAESIKQLQTLFQTSIGALNLQVQDVKSRLDKGEGGVVGHHSAVEDQRYERKDTREDLRDNRGLLFGIIGVVLGFVALVVGVMPHLAK